MKHVRRSSHGQSDNRLYGVWNAMIQRCCNPRHEAYASHGGRGIRVCDEWLEFSAFLTWAEANGGNRPKMSLARTDLSGPYSPANCRFVPESELAWMISAFGETKTPGEWAMDLRCRVPSATTIRARVRRGWDHIHALTTPPRGYRPTSAVARSAGTAPNTQRPGVHLFRYVRVSND